jgi:hypothetical protein
MSAILQSLTGYAALALAQPDIQVDVNTGSGGAAWYQTWWVWVLVGLFALIVIIALTSRGRAARE